jgi:hypothetical protein
MPKKTGKTDAKRGPRKAVSRTSSNKRTYNVRGGIHAGRDVIMGDQTNTYYTPPNMEDIKSSADFVAELEKLRAEIERLKKLPDVESTAARRLEAVDGDIQEAIDEAKKEQPAGERINKTLDSAKGTMEKLGENIASAINLGTVIGNFILLAKNFFGG